MAKQKMRCVFSEQLCRECPLFRGRHYYLCFSRTYRGYLGAERVGKEPSDGDHVLFTSTQKLSRSVALAEKRGKACVRSRTAHCLERNGSQQG